MAYTVTINIASAGTRLKNGSKSKTGHVWYQISDGINPIQSHVYFMNLLLDKL